MREQGSASTRAAFPARSRWYGWGQQPRSTWAPRDLPKGSPCGDRRVPLVGAGTVLQRGHNGVLCVSQGRYNAPRRGTLGYCPGWGEQQQLQLAARPAAALSSPGCLCPAPGAYVIPSSCSTVLGCLHPALSIPPEPTGAGPCPLGGPGEAGSCCPLPMLRREAASGKVSGVCAPSRRVLCRGGAAGRPCRHHAAIAIAVTPVGSSLPLGSAALPRADGAESGRRTAGHGPAHWDGAAAPVQGQHHGARASGE